MGWQVPAPACGPSAEQAEAGTARQAALLQLRRGEQAGQQLQAGSEKWGLLGVRVTRVDLLHKVHLSEFRVLDENWLNKQSHLYYIAEIIFLLLKHFLL